MQKNGFLLQTEAAKMTEQEIFNQMMKCLKAKIEESKLTDKELSQKSKLYEKTIRDLRAGVSTSLHILLKTCSALDLNIVFVEKGEKNDTNI